MEDTTNIVEVKPKHAGGRPRKYKSVHAMKIAINKYFTDDVIPTKAGLTLHLGFVNKVSLWDYRNNFPEFTALIDKTFTMLERYWEERLAGSQCAGATFWLKNNAGYTDKQTIVSVKPPEIPEREQNAVDKGCRAYKEALCATPEERVINIRSGRA
ncbi:hypothetical protein LCGC14_1706740 [marine sediment metagenome]|uniref:Uncharacterized protein n=1 Tax=marine sediment metagenome TaxID=412755 RepID=A0A0F9JWT2_9ZZZZ